MAKKPSTKTKPTKCHVGTYFTSLTVENIRSFGSPQTLDLTRNGRPAKWTIILGDNNLGKSTLLEVLDGMGEIFGAQRRDLIGKLQTWESFSLPSLLRARRAAARIDIELVATDISSILIIRDTHPLFC